jgi:SAM-dependent methyltransferase
VASGGAVLDGRRAAGVGNTRWFAGTRPSGDRGSIAISAAWPTSWTTSASSWGPRPRGRSPWPFPDRTFAAVVVTNYLWRPILADLVRSVGPGGWLPVRDLRRRQRAASAARRTGVPPASGELLEAVHGGFRVVAYEDVIVERSRARRRFSASPPPR